MDLPDGVLEVTSAEENLLWLIRGEATESEHIAITVKREGTFERPSWHVRVDERNSTDFLNRISVGQGATFDAAWEDLSKKRHDELKQAGGTA